MLLSKDPFYQGKMDALHHAANVEEHCQLYAKPSQSRYIAGYLTGLHTRAVVETEHPDGYREEDALGYRPSYAVHQSRYHLH